VNGRRYDPAGAKARRNSATNDSGAVPGSRLVGMEQAAVLMMPWVLAAEAGDRQRIHALVLGPVRTRAVPGEAS